jgi:hypothetical protein
VLEAERERLVVKHERGSVCCFERGFGVGIVLVSTSPEDNGGRGVVVGNIRCFGRGDPVLPFDCALRGLFGENATRCNCAESFKREGDALSESEAEEVDDECGGRR